MKYTNIEVILNDVFDEEEMEIINDFLEAQQTTDCETENTIIDTDGIIFQVLIKWDRPSKIIIGPLFGDILSKARNNKGITQLQMADKLGIHINTYNRYENGKRIPKAKQLLELIEMLDLDIVQVKNSIDIYETINKEYMEY